MKSLCRISIIDNNTSTSIIWVPLYMGRSAANRQGITQCLESGHPQERSNDFSFLNFLSSYSVDERDSWCLSISYNLPEPFPYIIPWQPLYGMRVWYGVVQYSIRCWRSTWLVCSYYYTHQIVLPLHDFLPQCHRQYSTTHKISFILLSVYFQMHRKNSILQYTTKAFM